MCQMNTKASFSFTRDKNREAYYQKKFYILIATRE